MYTSGTSGELTTKPVDRHPAGNNRYKDPDLQSPVGDHAICTTVFAAAKCRLKPAKLSPNADFGRAILFTRGNYSNQNAWELFDFDQ